MKRRIAAVVVLLVIVTAAALTRGLGLRDRPGPAVLTLYGNVDARAVDLGFRVGGRIAEMPVDEGARVEAGTVLARLDTRARSPTR